MVIEHSLIDYSCEGCEADSLSRLHVVSGVKRTESSWCLESSGEKYTLKVITSVILLSPITIQCNSFFFLSVLVPVKSKPSDVFTAVRALTVCCAAGFPDLPKVSGSQCSQKSIKNSLKRQTAALLSFSFSFKGQLIFCCLSAIFFGQRQTLCR